MGGMMHGKYAGYMPCPLATDQEICRSPVARFPWNAVFQVFKSKKAQVFDHGRKARPACDGSESRKAYTISFPSASCRMSRRIPFHWTWNSGS